MLTSKVLREHAETGKIVFGINHVMRDFKTGRKKNLDLVICTPKVPTISKTTLTSYSEANSISLTPEERKVFDDLPVIRTGEVGSVLVAVEAKAVMTAHLKALPRLHDELVSSHAVIHGAAEEAIAVGMVFINIAKMFSSTDMNKFNLGSRARVVSDNPQPNAAIRTVAKLLEIPRRTQPGTDGFDAFGIVLVDFENDGSSVDLAAAPLAIDLRGLDYTSMVHRIVAGYASRFSNL